MTKSRNAPLPVFEAILEALNDGVVACDAAGAVVWANAAAGDLLGAKDLVGRPAAQVDGVLGELIRDCLDGGAAGSARLTVGPPGVLTVAAFPLSATGGAVAALSLAVRSSRTGPGATRLSNLARHFATVLNCVSDGIWICDGDGVIVSINSASQRLNSIRAEDYVGKKVDSIVTAGLVDRSVTLDVLSSRRESTLIQHIKRTGKHLLVTGTPALGADGGISMVVVSERDVTELNALRQGLETAHQVQEGYRRELAELSMLELGSKDIVAESPQMRQVLGAVLKLATSGASEVLILGESGTGKGLLAKFLHKQSPRADKPFIPINCPALPENLFEAELFGYEKGAFTGAREQGKVGLIELAQGGTLFLDEIGDIPLAVQSKLLKYLDDHEFMRLGGNATRRVECCVVAATNQDLDRFIAQRQFRQDLFYRLNTFIVRIPPLRERREDIFGLAHYYLARFNAQYHTAKRLSPRAVQLLEGHDYPGNVRELVGILNKSVVMSEGDDLAPAIEAALSDRENGRNQGRSDEPRSLAEKAGEAEALALRRAFAVCRTTREMARYLGVSQPTVVRKMRKFGLTRKS